MRRIEPLALLLLVTLPLIAQKTQTKGPWNSTPCKEKPACGVVVKFDPPLDAAKQGGYSSSGTEYGPLLVPNEVTVEVPLELHASRVVVSSYPLGTEVADIPPEGFVTMDHFEKVGSYARFRGEIKKCTDQGSVQVNVYCKGYESYPIAAFEMAIECRENVPKNSNYPPPTK